MQALNRALEWITKVAYLNLLWIFFTLLGAGVLGLFPSTAATFMVTKKWITGSHDAPVFKVFLKAYKDSFKEANIIGYIILIFSYILYLDFLFITVSPSDYALLLTIPLFFISILFILTVMYIFPVYVYYEMRILQVLKSSFFIMILNPLSTLVMGLGVFGITFVLWQFQGLAIFFGLSLPSVALMMPANRAFKKIQEKELHIRRGHLTE